LEILSNSQTNVREPPVLLYIFVQGVKVVFSYI
jgi:hypothetical protein